MCKWSHQAFAQYSCKEPPTSGNGYCIFHDPSSDKNDKLKCRLEDQVKGNGKNPRFNFTGYVFPQGWNDWHNDLIERVFPEKVTFRLARFEEGTSFHHVKFKAEAVFTAAQFESYGDFRLSEFERYVDFSEANFQGHGDFVNAKLAKEKGTEARFSRVSFNNGADFKDAMFFSESTFKDSSFEGTKTTFEDTTFEEQVSFEGATFSSDSLEFIDTDFKDTADFSQCRFLRGLALLHADLSEVKLASAFLEATDFTHASWNQYVKTIGYRSLCRDDLEAQDPSDYEKANKVCREIKQSYQRSGDYRKAGEFYYGEMECQRRSLNYKDNLLEKSFYQLARIVTGYGESVSRVVLTSLTVIGLWSVIFFLKGFNVIGQSIISSKTLPIVKQIGGSVYFSVVTFTTLGLGDIQPLYPIGHLMVSLEAMLGGFLMALFVVIFARKFMR